MIYCMYNVHFMLIKEYVLKMEVFLVTKSDSLLDPGRLVCRSVCWSVCLSVCLSVGLSVCLSAICAFLRICLESLGMTWKCFKMLKNVRLDLLCACMRAHWLGMCT